MNNTLPKTKKYILTLVAFMLYVIQYAQEVKPPNPGRPGGGHPGENLPIDGGIFLLSILAVAYGVMKKK